MNAVLSEYKEVKWSPLKDYSDLTTANTHVFKINVDKQYSLIAQHQSKILSEKELLKASKFQKSKDGERYIVSKYFLRHILSSFTGNPAHSIQFHQFGNKKPSLEGIEFNVTHSGDFILIIVSPHQVGVDMEFINRNFNFEILLEDCFNEAEKQFINSGSTESLYNFYRLWTRKEAILKASGEGLVDRMNELDCLSEHVIRKGVKYQLKTFNMEADYYASLAVQINEASINFWIV